MKKKEFKWWTLIVLGIMTIIISCTNKRDEILTSSDCSSINAKFSSDVNPIIISTCAINSGCHGAGSVNGPGPLTSYTLISRAATDIKNAVVSKRMPLGSSLSDADINKIKCWVDSGALNN